MARCSDFLPPPSGAMLWTVNETAAQLRCGRNRVYDLINSGALKTIKNGRRTLVTASSVQGYLAQQGVPHA